MALTTIPFLAPTDHNKNEARNMRIHVLASAPSSPVSGQVYYDSVLLSLGWYNGSAWIYPATLEGTSVPVALGTAATGSGGTGSKYDHVHPTTGLALVGAANTFTTGTQTIQGALVVSGGNWQLDAQGRSAALGGANAAILSNLGSSAAHPGSATALYGLNVDPAYPATTTVQATNLRSQMRLAAAAFTLTTGVSMFVDVPVLGAGSAITTLEGLYIANQGASGIANAIGLAIQAQSGAATLNIAAQLNGGTQANLWLNNDTASKAGGIAFGTARDADLYRNAANVLRTTGSIIADLGFDAGSHRITSVLDPTSAQDAATKAYVDAVVQGLAPKGAAAAATTTTLPANTYNNGTAGNGATLTGNSNGALAAIDGYTPVAGDILLIKNEAAPANNGLYTVTTLGTGSVPYVLTRTGNMDSATEIAGAHVFVRNGTANINQGWIVDSSGPYTVGTTAITWSQFTGMADITAGAGLTKTGNSIDVVGTANRILVNADSIDIDSNYVGQSSITTLGTITTGVWTGTTVALLNGGTGATTAAGARTNLGATGKASGNVGDGSSTTIDFAHNLNTTDVTIFVRENTVPGSEVHPVKQVKDVNTVTLVFGAAPASNAYRCTVTG